MKWEVTTPPGFTPAMEATLERLKVERVTGWMKKQHGVYLFNVAGESSHLGREVVVGPRGGLHSDTQVDHDAKKARKERKQDDRYDLGVYSKSGELIGLRLW